MERIYPAYVKKIKNNNKLAKENGKQFAETLNNHYRKLKTSKSESLSRLSKLPVRIYGSGDFIPEHSWFLIDLDFPFFIISKNLTTPELKFYIERLVTLEMLKTIVLSFDSKNIDNYKGVSGYSKNNKIKFSFTGLAEQFDIIKEQYYFDIFFNIDKKKLAKEKSATFGQACPCDSGKLEHNDSCSYCSKCWR